MIYRFADCVLDTHLHTLERAGQQLRLPPKVFEVLAYLLAHRDRVVSKQELCVQVWQGTVISEATLESCLRSVRTSVGDSGQAQRIIQTQRGYGYRFVAVVERLPEALSHPAPPPAATPLAPPLLEPEARPCVSCHYINPAAATFCAACGTRLYQPCLHCGQMLLLPSAFCTACGQAHLVAAPPGGALAVPPRVSTPPEAHGGGAERKLVTVLCCAVAWTARARVALDALYHAMQELHALAQEVGRPYGGRVQATLGDRLLLFFGVPDTHEDDARRAVRVALDLRQRWQEPQKRLGPEASAALALRIGLHTGWMVVSGGPDDAKFAPMVGDVVSMARGFQEQAAPDQILCSTATARLVQRTVRLASVEPVVLPGQPTPVPTYAVLRPRGRRAPGWARWGRMLSLFVDRERELTTLLALLAQVEAGRGQVVGIVGEPGIGKSRLLYEFRQRLAGRPLTYLAGRCLSYGSTTPYLPVLEILRHNCNILETDRPEAITAKVHRALQEVDLLPEAWAPVLLYFLGVPGASDAFAVLSPEVRKARILAAGLQLCLQGSRRQPLLLELEDLHWIDASSEECLAALVERVAGAAILILVTYRPGYRPAWIDKSYATQVALPPLTSPDSQRLVQAVLPAAVQAAPLVPQVLAKAEGNPFFLEELARTVVEQGANALAAPVPDTVQAVLTARMDRLPTSAKHLLQAAAVIGKEVVMPLVQAVTDVPEEILHGDLRSLQVAEFLYETYTRSVPTYAFKHVLTQEVAYQSLMWQVRQHWHARIAQVLEVQFPEVVETQPELLAHHYTEAGLAEQALPYWQRAGQRAVERSANHEAISHFTHALELLKTWPETPERVQHELTLQLAIGAPLLMLKGHTAPEVEHAYTRAYELAQQLGETPQRFAVLVGLWRFYFSQAQLQRAHELAEQCFTLAQRLHAPTSLQEGYEILGSTLFFLGDPVAAHAYLERGIALYDAQQSGDLAFSRGTDPGVVCLSRLAWALWWLGYPDQALVRSHEALALAQRLSQPYSLNFALSYNAILHLWRREPSLVKEQVETMMSLMQEHGFVQFRGGGMARLGWALVEQGAVDEGIAQLHQALEAYRMHGVWLGRHEVLATLAAAYGKAGQPQEGLRVMADAITLALHNAELNCEAEWYRLKGELLLQSDSEDLERAREAESCFQQALAVARRQQAKSFELRAAMSLSRLWQRQGKQAAARHILAEIYSWFTEGFDTPDLRETQALLAALQ